MSTKKLQWHEGNIDIITSRSRIQVYLNNEPLSSLSYLYGDILGIKLTIRGKEGQYFCVDNFYIDTNVR